MLIEQAHLLPPLLITQAKHKSSRHIENGKEIKNGVLCHGNFDLSAILTRRGQVIQMIGFDRALSADPAWDFRSYRHISKVTPGALAPLCDGYQSINPFDSTFFERAEFYSLIGEMETLCLARHFGDNDAVSASVRRFRGLLDSQ